MAAKPLATPVEPRAPGPLGVPGDPIVVTLLGGAVVTALYFGQEILKPLALALLLSFVLAPLVVRLRRIGLGRIPAAIVVVLFASSLVAGLGVIVTSQLFDLAENLPRYERNLIAKVRGLKDAAPTGGVIDRTMETIRGLGEELQEAARPEPRTVGRAEPTGEVAVQRPVPVEVHEPEPSPWDTLVGFAGPLMAPVATAGMVIVFVVFMLIQREDLRDRAIRLLGARDLTRATGAMNDAAARVSRYLLMQLIINVSYGVPVGLGLWLIGVPNPLLWALLAIILRFIPYLGPFLAASFPIALSLAVDPGWTMVALTVGLIVVLELFSNNVLEPWLYGSSTGLSPVAVIIAAVVWTTLWGPVGLLLSTPLTVCLVVLGQHVPQLQFLDILLGSRPPLALPARIYQRLLARDLHEAVELAEDHAEEHGPQGCSESLLLPVLVLAERDRERGVLTREMQQAVAEGVTGLGDLIVDAALSSAAAAAEGDEPPPATAGSVLCVGARNELDTAAATILARLLELEGIRASALSHLTATPLTLQRLRREGVALVCPSYVGPSTPQHARRLARRLRSHLGQGLPLVAGLWADDDDTPEVAAAVGVDADAVCTSLAQMLAEVRERLGAKALAAGPAEPDGAPPATSATAA